MMLSSLTEEDKKRANCKKITEEEAEVFDFPENARPVLVSEPSFELKWYNKIDPTTQTARLNSEEEETVKMSQRLLQLLLKTEMLDSMAVHKYDDVRAIRVFFMDDREVPTEKLVAILDNVLTVAMAKLGQYSDKISVVVDYEMRAFMSDSVKAKRMILETMLKFPENIPDSWGGEAAMMKWKVAKEADVRRREADEKDREKEMAAESERKEKEKEEAKKKEERIRKEVEEAEKKKKEEKEKRRKEAQELKKKEEKRKKEKEEKEKEKKKDEKRKTKRGKKADVSVGSGTLQTFTFSFQKTREQSKEPTCEVVQNSPATPNIPSGPLVKKPVGKKLISKETSAAEIKTTPSPNTGGGPAGGLGGIGGAAKRFLTQGRMARKTT